MSFAIYTFERGEEKVVPRRGLETNNTVNNDFFGPNSDPIVSEKLFLTVILRELSIL